MSRTVSLTSAMTFALLLSGALPCAAADILVSNMNDSGPGSLRQAIASADANGGDTIVFPEAFGGTIQLTSGEIVIDKSLTIAGPGRDWLQLSGNNASRVFRVSAGKSVTLSGVKVVNGSVSGGSGGGIYNEGSLVIQDCAFLSNQMSGGFGDGGGAIYSSGAGILTVDTCEFSDNYAHSSSGAVGGAILAEGGLTVLNSIFVANQSPGYRGGAIGVSGGLSDPAVDISGSTFESNAVGQDGGALYNGGRTVAVSRCSFLANIASGDTYSSGGAIYNIYGALSVVNSHFTDNRALGSEAVGGGIYSYGDASAVNCTFANNVATYQGGGFAGFYYDMRLDNCILWGNYAGSGPQVMVQFFDMPGYDGGTITVAHSDVQGGLAGQNGVVDGGGNIDANPLFVADPYSNPPGDVRLSVGSPCINTGNNAAVPGSATTDRDGAARIQYGTVDMGAYEYAFTDTVAPTLTWGSPSPVPNAGGWNNSTVTLPFTTADADSGVASVSPSGPLTFSQEGAGQTQEVTVTDNAGNSATFTSPAINIDLTAPTTSDSISGSTVTLAASDNLSGVAATYYTVDGGAAQTYSGPFSLTAGAHSVRYWSVDNAGNTEETRTLNVDTRIAVTVTVANVSGRRGGKVNLSVTVTQIGNNAKLSGKAVTILVDGVFVGNATTNKRGVATLAYTIPTSLTPGVYTIAASSNPDGTHLSGYGTGTLTVTR